MECSGRRNAKDGRPIGQMFYGCPILCKYGVALVNFAIADWDGGRHAGMLPCSMACRSQELLTDESLVLRVI